MNAMLRFILALSGHRVRERKDDEERWPWWAGPDEDPSFGVIRAEARQRAHDDLMEAMAKGDAQPKKRLGVITTADIGKSKKEGQK